MQQNILRHTIEVGRYYYYVYICIQTNTQET